MVDRADRCARPGGAAMQNPDADSIAADIDRLDQLIAGRWLRVQDGLDGCGGYICGQSRRVCLRERRRGGRRSKNQQEKENSMHAHLASIVSLDACVALASCLTDYFEA